MAENENNTEEVDLGNLFLLIGNGIKNLFKAIGNFFSALFHYFILMILFLKKHYIIISIATLAGGVLGYLIDKNTQPVYQSESIIETNYGSGHELYNQVNHINTLLRKGKINELAQIFKIPKDEIKSLRYIEIEPFEKESNKIKEFYDYIQHVDTITIDLTVEEYSKRLKDEDYRFQKITAYGNKQSVFSKLGDGFLALTNNNYFKNIVDTKVLEINNRKKSLNKSLKEIDSVRNLYKKVALLTAKNEKSANTNIHLTENQNESNGDIALFNQTDLIFEQLKETNEDMMRYGYITKTFMEFELGYQDLEGLNKRWLLFGLLGFLGAVLSILGVRFNTYLKNYNK